MSIPDANGVIHGAYSNITGDLRVFDDSEDSPRGYETGLDWNQTGPQGPVGPQGPQGVQGATGPAGPEGVISFSQVVRNGIRNSYVANGTIHTSGLAAPNGYKIISGGYEIFDSNQPTSDIGSLKIYFAEPEQDGSVYRVKFSAANAPSGVVDCVVWMFAIPA